MFVPEMTHDAPSWGFGRDCIGGSLGDLYLVSNLEDDGEGSLRHGIESADGPRTIRFDVEGTINLATNLEIRKPYISIIGPARGSGITIAKQSLRVVGTRHIELRNLRFRLGDQSGELDCCDVTNSEYVLIDRCSFSWSVDECVSITRSRHCTLQRCIVAYSLYDSVHHKGVHALAGIYTGRVSLIGNLFAHHDFRPLVSGDIQVIGNVFYNYFRSYPIIANSEARVDIANNVFKCGPSTVRFRTHSIRTINLKSEDSRVWLAESNRIQMPGEAEPRTPEIISNHPVERSDFPFHAFVRPTDPLPGVLETAGCSSSDNLDLRVLSDVRRGEGQIINSPDDVGGFDGL